MWSESPPSSQLLKARESSFSSSNLLGPPDLVQVVWEKSPNSFFSRIITQNPITTYFSIYGADTSSPNSLGVYAKLLLQELESSAYFDSKFKVTKISFHVFDSFHGQNVQVSFNFPGKTKIKLTSKSGELLEGKEPKWDSLYLSSLLRAMYPGLQPFSKSFRILTTLSDVNRLYTTICKVFRIQQISKEIQQPLKNKPNKSAEEWLDLIDLKLPKDSKNQEAVLHPLFDVANPSIDPLSTNGSLILSLICQYFCQRNLMEFGLQFFSLLQAQVPKAALFIVRILIETSKKDLVLLRHLGATILRFPDPSFLFFQAQLLTKNHFIKMAISLLENVLEMNSLSFDVWMLLLENYFEAKEYFDVIRIIALMPLTGTALGEYQTDDSFLKMVENSNVVSTKNQSSSNSQLDYLQKMPNKPDFKFFVLHKKCDFNQNGYFEESKEILAELSALPASENTERLQKVYSIFTQVKNEIGLWSFFSLISRLFEKPIQEKNLEESQDQSPKDSFLPSSSPDKLRKYSSPIDSPPIIQRKRPSIRNLAQKDDDTEVSFFPTNSALEDSSVGSLDQSDAFFGVPKSQEKNYSTLELPTTKTPFVSTDPDLKSKETKSSDESFSFGIFADYLGIKKAMQVDFLNFERKIRMNQIILEKCISEKSYNRPILSQEYHSKEFSLPENYEMKVLPLRQKEQIKLFMNELFYDMEKFVEWMEEESKPKIKELLPVIPYHGLVWVERGFLAERLGIWEWAEAAYLKALEIGMSGFALMRLLSLYQKNFQVEEMLLLIDRILFEPINGELETNSPLPFWIGQIFNRAIREIGQEEFIRRSSNLKMNFKPKEVLCL